MASRRHILGVLGGLGVVLAGPAFLAWSAFKPEPFTARNLRARFRSARYEAAALVFTYTIENRTGRAAYLAPGATEIRARQAPGRPAAGFPFVQFPIELPAHGVQTVEVRLDLPANRRPTDWVAIYGQGAGMPPWPGAQVSQPASPPPSPEAIIAGSLEALDGFELVNEKNGLRLVLPRGW
jgi:hypothetical protein